MDIIGIILAAALSSGPVAEDDPLIAAAGAYAQAALVQAHPECDTMNGFDYNVDASGGQWVVGFAKGCQYAGVFYRSPEGTVWTFAVEGA